MLPQKSDRYEKFCKIMRERIFEDLKERDDYFVNLDEECLKRMTFKPDGIWAMRCLSAIQKKMENLGNVKEKIFKNW